MMKKKFLFIVVLFALGTVDLHAQCAMCRAVLESGTDQSAAKGINDGIMYLMVFPYLLMAGVAYMVWRSRKKSKAEQ